MDDYEKQANDFLAATGTEIRVYFLRNGKHFVDDTVNRNIYACILRNKNGERKFVFGQSIINSRANIAPTAYDLLSCLTKADPGSFENFCAEYGFDTDSRKAKKIYPSVVSEWASVKKLFTPEEIEKLQEIN